LDVPPPGAGVNTVTVAVPAVAMSAAVIAAVRRAEDTYVVVRPDPFHWTREPLTKPVPFTVSVNAVPPAVRDVGLRPVIVGTGLVLVVIVKVRPLDVPPPGAGVNTVTVAVPAVAISAAVITAVSWVADTYVVVRPDPFQRTAEVFTKLFPFTVNVNAVPPAFAVAGLRLVVVGTGLLIAKARAFEVPPPGAGVNTVTDEVPAVAMSAAVIWAVSWVADTYVVVRLVPFHWTVELDAKLLPLTVSVKAVPPAVPDEGLRLVIAGTGAPDVLVRLVIRISLNVGVAAGFVVASPNWYWIQRLFALVMAEPLV